jgi:hypothetical protein
VRTSTSDDKTIDAGPLIGNDGHVDQQSLGVIMAGMWKRGSQCRYFGTKIAAVRLSGDYGIVVRPEHNRLPIVT